MTFALLLAAALHADTITVTDTTWFVTNRAPAGATFAGERRDALEYGYVITRYAEHASTPPADPWGHALKRTAGTPVRVSREEFRARIGEAAREAAVRGEGPVVYVHGFATSFGRAMAQGADIAHRGRFHGPFIVFSWPAHVASPPLPRPSALVSRAYRDDSATGAASGDAFRRALDDVVAAAPARSVTVVAHSLGSQLVGEALAGESALREALVDAPLRALVFFAPDAPAVRFRDAIIPSLIDIAERRVVYASQADRMLTISRLVNKSARAGQAGGERVLAGAELELVDVTRGRRASGPIRNMVEPRHAMRYASAALRDFFGVARGVPGVCRAEDGLAELVGPRQWRLRDLAPPAGDVTCAPASGSPDQVPPAR
jgi:esterase/lipase superfamily enzyme